jgi:hypothetical protein
VYEVVKQINILDVSVGGIDFDCDLFFLQGILTVILHGRGHMGTEIWVATENAYNEWVSHTENQIIALLRDRLGTARNTNKMFRVFSKFNALFVWLKVHWGNHHSSHCPFNDSVCRSKVLSKNTRPI